MSALRLSPEARLLFDAVCAVRPTQGNAAASLDFDTDDGVDWALLGHLAEREKLLPMLWTCLSGSGDRLPPPVAAAFRRHAVVTEFRMAALEAQLHGVIRLLDAHGIPVMLLKGAAMAVTVYGSFARRPMGDIDLVVRNAHAQKAWQLLHDAGWRPEAGEPDAFFDEHQHLCPLESPGGASIVVELHRCLLYPRGPFQLPEEGIWDAAVPVTVGACTAWVPSPPHQVLHMCIHYAWSHSMGRGVMRTVRDIGALIAACDVDWPRLLELAQQTHARSCCYWTLRLARHLAGAAVPPEVLDELAASTPRFGRDALERLLTHMALDARDAISPSLRVRQFVWECAIRPAANGHGTVRPWTLHAGWTDVVHSPPPPSVAARLRDQLSRVPHWLRFFRVLVGARTT